MSNIRGNTTPENFNVRSVNQSIELGKNITDIIFILSTSYYSIIYVFVFYYNDWIVLTVYMKF